MDHYRAVANVYSLSVFYDSTGPFVSWLRTKLSSALKLTACGSLADVGGGTGQFACEIATDAGMSLSNVVVVEPSAAMLHSGTDSEEPAIECHQKINLGAREWSELPQGDARAGPVGGFSHLMLKEVVHHFEEPRSEVFKLMHDRRLKSGAKLVIMTRPQSDIDYPFFPAAREVWKANQPAEDDLKADLYTAGFTHVKVEMLRYPITVYTDKWCEMIANRFWSTFSQFSDDELRTGIADIRRAAGESETVSFEERIIIIVATKD